VLLASNDVRIRDRTRPFHGTTPENQRTSALRRTNLRVIACPVTDRALLRNRGMNEGKPSRCPWCGMVTIDEPHRALDDCIRALEIQIERLKTIKALRDSAQRRFSGTDDR
jgi:hypothetical protein